MLFKNRVPRHEFHYEPLFLKEEPKELRERLRIPREEGRHRPRRSVLFWVVALAAALMLFEWLFPGSVASLRRPDVQIGLNDQVIRLRDAMTASPAEEAVRQDARPDSTARPAAE